MEKQTFDLIIRGASIYDGESDAAYTADVGIQKEKIVEIGDIPKTAGPSVNGQGLSLMPGIIDIHTHYDAQLTWDPTLSPSPSMGVTTVVIGNCGFGIAPCPPETRELMLKNLSVVEGMNLETLLGGTRWKFESFESYLEFIKQQKPYANVAALVGHSTVRTAVMGDKASITKEPSAEEMTEMRNMVDGAIAAGAIGFASSFSPNHSGFAGKPMPSTIAGDHELMELLAPLKKNKKGVFVSATGSRATPQYMENIHKRFGCPSFMVTVLAMHNQTDPELSIRYYENCDGALERGHEVYIHANPHPLSFDFTLRNPYIFFAHSAFDKIKSATADQLKMIYQSSEFKQEFIENLKTIKSGALFNGEWKKIELNEIAITTIAKNNGKNPLDWLFEQSLDTTFVAKLFQNDNKAVAKLLTRPSAVIGLSDAGAHVEFLCDAGFGLFFLEHWVKNTQSFTLSEGVKKLTSDIAKKYRIKERGKIKPGFFADLVFFDPEKVGLTDLYKSFDLPSNGSRMLRKPKGVHGVWVNGQRVAAENSPLDLDSGPGKILTEFSF